MNKPRVRVEGGFSIVELLVAVAVLAVGLLGLAQLIGVALQQNDFARYNTTAIEVAQGKLEELRALYNWQVASGGSSSDLSDGGHGPVTVVLASDSQSYGSRSMTVSWTVSSPTTVRKDIVIRVIPTTSSEAHVSKPVIINTSLTP
jgi:prepilin-type N-terminal cleavage/methylation domain-containing protein